MTKRSYHRTSQQTPCLVRIVRYGKSCFFGRSTKSAPAKKIKFREDDGESRLFGQHRWNKGYYDPTATVSSNPPRTHHVNAMSLFKDLHEILKTLDDPSGYRFQMDSYLDWSDIHDLQDWNIRERAARRQTRAEAAHLRKMPVCHVPKDTRTFCVPGMEPIGTLIMIMCRHNEQTSSQSSPPRLDSCCLPWKYPRYSNYRSLMC